MIKGIYIEKRVVNMPINVHSELPAKKIMESENIFMMDENRAYTQDIRPLKIAVLNLMPLKEDTEVQLLRSLSNTPAWWASSNLSRPSVNNPKVEQM